MKVARAIRTHDRSLVTDLAGQYFTPTALGKSRKVTPEGFLVCQGVPIARTGIQLYGAHELPEMDSNGTGNIAVERSPAEVFSPETLASFESKPLTIEHPEDGVSPETWKRHAIGHVTNVRQGSGIENDLVIADLIVTTPEGIRYVNKEMPQISAGYESDYEQTGRGTAVQKNIRGNHVALVENGRAGARVAVRDSKQTFGGTMRTKDALLSTLPGGRKSIALGQVWRGDLKPLLDTYIDQLDTWVTPFSSGHVLSAEAAPAMLDLGQQWLGNMESQIRRAVSSNSGRTQGGDFDIVDLSKLSEGLGQAQAAIVKRDLGAMKDSLKALRRLSGSVGRATGDARTAFIRRDQEMRQELKERNSASAAFWSGTDRTQPQPPARSAASGTNDSFLAEQHRKGNAAMRDHIRSLNDRSREHWEQHARDMDRQMGRR